MPLSTLLLSPPILLLCPSLSLASFGVAASLPIGPHLPPFPLTPVGPSFPPHLEYFSKGNSQPEGYTEDEHYKMNEVDPYSASSHPYNSGDNEQDYYFFDNKQDDYPTHGDTGVLFNGETNRDTICQLIHPSAEAVEYEDDYLDRFSPEVVEDVVDLSNHIGPLGNILVTGALVFVLRQAGVF